MLEEVKVKDKGIDEKAKADQLKAQTEAFKAQLNYEAEMKKIFKADYPVERRTVSVDLDQALGGGISPTAPDHTAPDQTASK